MSNNNRLSDSRTKTDATVVVTNMRVIYECLEFVFLLGMQEDSWEFKRQEDVQVAVNALVKTHGAQISFACQVLAGLGLAKETNDPDRILGYRATMQLGLLVQNIVEQYGVSSSEPFLQTCRTAEELTSWLNKRNGLNS